VSRRAGFHEDFRRGDGPGPGSERGFGVVFAVVFAVIAAWPLFFGGGVRWWSAVVAAVFLVAAFAAPRILAPLNRLWYRIGMALHGIVTPVIMGILFFLTVMPTGLIMRLFGKDPLRLRFDAEAQSYWIQREPPGPEPDSMRNQF